MDLHYNDYADRRRSWEQRLPGAPANAQFLCWAGLTCSPAFLLSGNHSLFMGETDSFSFFNLSGIMHALEGALANKSVDCRLTSLCFFFILWHSSMVEQAALTRLM